MTIEFRQFEIEKDQRETRRVESDILRPPVRQSTASCPSRAIISSYLVDCRSNAIRTSISSFALSSIMRMECCCFMGWVVRDIEPKACAEIGDTLCPDISVMALENALHDSQADAAAGQVWRMVQALEDPKSSW